MTHITDIARWDGDPRIVRSGPSSRGVPDQLARALGWFSIGLGVVELLAPERITRALGMEGQENLVRAFGAREIAAGVMTLSTETRLGLLSRIAGDALDIATLIPATRADNPKHANACLALSAVLGVTLLDVIGAQAVSARHARSRGERRDYRNRSGFPKGVQAAKGAAKALGQSPNLRKSSGASKTGPSSPDVQAH